MNKPNVYKEIEKSTVEKPILFDSISTNVVVSTANFGVLVFGGNRFGLVTKQSVVEKPLVIDVVDGVSY